MKIPNSITKNVELVAYHDLAGRPAFKMAMKKHGDKWYMYTGHLWHRGWTIMDMTDPYHPQHVKFVDGPDNTHTAQVSCADDLLICALEVIGGGIKGREHLWGRDLNRPNEEGFVIFDVKDPVNPKQLGHFKTGGNGTHRNCYCGGKYVYLAANMDGYKGNIMVVVDISDPTNPTEVGRWWYPGQWVAGHEEEFFPQPHFTGYHHGPCYPVGDKAYLPYGRAGVVVLDMSDIKHPKKIGHMSIGDFGSVIGLHTVLPIPERGIAITTMEAILEDERDPLNLVLVLDITKDNPKPIAAFPNPTPPPEMGIKDFFDKGGKYGPHNIPIPFYQDCLEPTGNIIPVSYESAGVWFFDITDPGAPKVCGYFIPDDPTERVGILPRDLATQTEDVLVDARGFVYISDKNHGLFILKYKPE